MIRLPVAFGLVFFAFSLPASAQDAKPSGPILTIQTQPLGRLLGDVRTVLEAVGGKAAVAKFNETLTDRLGEKGLSGLDVSRPLLGTMPKIDAEGNPSLLILVPITSEKEFLDLLKRADFELEPVEKRKGLFTVVLPEDLGFIEKAISLRIVDKIAYFGSEMTADEMDAKKLPTAEAVADPKATDTLTVRSFIQNQPKAYVEQQAERLKQAEASLDALPIPEKFKTLTTDLFAEVTRFSTVQNRDGDVQTIRLNVDPKSLDVSLTASLTAKPGTALLKSMQAYKPTGNRFAGIASQDAAASLLLRLPLFDDVIRKAAAAGLEEGLPAAKAQAPEPLHDLIDEAFAGVARTVKTGRVELGASMVPNKTGDYTLDLGVSFADPAKLEKLIRGHAALLPEDKARITWDDFTVGTVKVHRVDFPQFTKAKDFPDVFGGKSTAYLAFAPDAIFVSFGADAKDHITANITAKDAPAPVLEVALNGGKLRKFLEAFPADDRPPLDKFGDRDERIVMSSLTVTGGQEFVVRWRGSLRFFLGFAKTVDE